MLRDDDSASARRRGPRPSPVESPSPEEWATAPLAAVRAAALALDVEAETPGSPNSSADAVAGAHFSVRGRAVDMDGAPIVGVSVAVAHQLDESLAVTGAGGVFDVQLLEAEYERSQRWNSSPWLCVADEGWVTARQSRIAPFDRSMEHIVVAARRTTLEGRVEDMGGGPIDGAGVSLSPQGEALFGFPYPLDLTRVVARRASSDASQPEPTPFVILTTLQEPT